MQSVHFGWSIKFSLFIRFTSAALYTQMFFNEVNVIDGCAQTDKELKKQSQHNKRAIAGYSYWTHCGVRTPSNERDGERAAKRGEKGSEWISEAGRKVFDHNGFKQMNLKSAIFAKRLILCRLRCAYIHFRTFYKSNGVCRLADRRGFARYEQKKKKKRRHDGPQPFSMALSHHWKWLFRQNQCWKSFAFVCDPPKHILTSIYWMNKINEKNGEKKRSLVRTPNDLLYARVWSHSFEFTASTFDKRL